MRRLRLQRHVEHLAERGAFDPRDFAAGGWKLAPEVESVVVGHVQPTVVYEHEEGP